MGQLSGQEGINRKDLQNPEGNIGYKCIHFCSSDSKLHSNFIMIRLRFFQWIRVGILAKVPKLINCLGPKMIGKAAKLMLQYTKCTLDLKAAAIELNNSSWI